MAEKVFVNGEVRGVEGGSVGDFFAQVRSEALKRGEVIVDVFIDGDRIVLQKDEDYRDLTLADVQSVEIKTENVRAVTLRALDTIYSSVDRTRAHGEQAASDYRLHSLSKAYPSFAFFLEEVEYLLTLLNSYQAFFGSVPEKVQEVAKSLKENLQEGLQLFEQESFVALADVIEHELVPLYQELTAEVPRLLQQASYNLH